MPTLKELSIALGLLSSDHNPAAEVDGWKNYVWRVRNIADCRPVQNGYCDIISDRWDWKRQQFYQIAYRADSVSSTITTRITLRNEDSSDDDQVCIVVSYFDAMGDEIGVFFANWRALPGRAYTREAPIILSRPVSDVASLAAGSKQCDAKATIDAQNYYRMRLALKQK
ncbi:hypothetical protein KX729_33010 [Rhizobium sp. XQZ8]|uniref:hypothetical protein n=1 Tax=Rhizobium populisoli TaxID=2859785 RepID=UPI001CA51513|nr:hypothetical protein [Rhizobium populisoli]MBW6426170.1 hypothetical protein [Rhizobium populisoli]